MNKLYRKYLSEVKSFFPVMGNSEKRYLAKLSKTIEDYCQTENTTTLTEIYNGFGHPREIVNAYLNTVDTSQLIRKIQLAKWIKRGLISVLLITLIGVSIFGITTYKAYRVLEEEQIYFEEETIE